MFEVLKRKTIDHVKNLRGWKTKRKIVVISIDDYGNVRLDSKAARINLNDSGLKILSRFDAYDSLENTEDLEILFETLSSVKDKNGNGAIFSPFSLPCNIDFERIREDGYQSYYYELLPKTYEKLSAVQKEYKGTWHLWKEGIKGRFMAPQFHGREHINLKAFNEKLQNKDLELLTSLKNRSLTSISGSGYDTISYTAAFDFWAFEDNRQFETIINDGLDAFEKVYGYKAVNFNSPGGREHPAIHKFLKKKGVKYIDTPWIKNEHQGHGQFKKKINYTGKRNDDDQTYLVRNVVFEPTDNRGFDWVNYTLKQMETAFFWNQPAIISSHRVNFCGHIDPKNRRKGIESLGRLLKGMLEKWPNIEFMSVQELGDLVSSTK